VNVGLYLDLRNPPEWRRPWAEAHGAALELCEEADRLGGHSVWMTEHHLAEDGYLPQPLVFAAAVAGRTRRLRVGTSLLIAPLRSAAHIAEEAAVVDLVSGGRLELGLGAGYRPVEFELFGADYARRGRDTLDRAREVRRLWAEGRLLPPPAQERVPIWIGAAGEWTTRRAGRLGEGLLRISGKLLGAYRQGLEEGGHDPDSGRMSGSMNALLTDDPERDWPRIAPHLAYQASSYAAWIAEGRGPGQPPPRPADPEEMRARGIEQGLTGGFMVTTPEDAAQRIRAVTDGLPVETIYFWATLPGLPQELAERNVELACTRLAPLLA
jgi:alkanesulfonate monooxygenase SsuD/methylene tetrahydromethanopterin reductase-like flavin-dependent oxidoreductase (luciferase family)